MSQAPYLPLSGKSHAAYNHAFRALESALHNLHHLDDTLFRVSVGAQSRESAALYCSAAMDCLTQCLRHIQQITPLPSRAE